MKLLVCAKAVASFRAPVRITSNAASVDPDVLEFGPNEWDLAAAEEALCLRDQKGGEVVAATCGTSTSEKTLRRLLAMGFNRAVLVEGVPADPMSVARALTDVALLEQPDLIFCGARSSDSGHASTGSMLAELLGMPCAAVVTRVFYDEERRLAVVERELEGGLIDHMEIDTPAVLTIQTGISQPRYANLRALKKAESLTIDIRRPVREGPPAYSIRRVFHEQPANHAEMIGGDAAHIAQRIAEILRTRLS